MTPFRLRLWHLIKHESLQLIGPTLFFFVAFNILSFTKKLFLEDYQIYFAGFFLKATIGAFLVGKAVLLADEIPWINRFPAVPLMYNVAWKTVVYSLAALVVQFLEEMLPLLWRQPRLAGALAQGWQEIHWPHFWAIHILLCYFLLIYVSFRELARSFGEKQFLHLFFGFPRGLPDPDPAPSPQGQEK